MTIPDVLLHYERRLSEAHAGLATARIHSASAAAVLAIAAALLLTLGVYAIRRQIPVWWPSLPVPVAAASAGIYRRRRQAEVIAWRVKRFYHRAIQRLRGEWIGNGFTGEEFDDPHHPYAHDLGIFGTGSLFELLCIARSGVGQRGLAAYLTEPPAAEESRARQQAVEELRGQIRLREKIAVLGPHEFSDSHWETFRDWLDSSPILFRRPLRIAIFLSSSILAAVLLAGALGLLPWIAMLTWSAPLLAFHAALGLMLRRRIAPMIDSLRSLSVETQVIREGLGLLENQHFQSPKLVQLSASIRGAARSVRKLERMLNALTERNKEWFYLPSLVLMIGTQLCMAIEDWRLSHRTALRVWLAAWAEFEALNALACYAYEHPESTFPEFSDGETSLEARALGHPLLPRETCVPNDVHLNRASRFYIVSGSNMSGKSTLLRAIGLNVVLAHAGATVGAGTLRLSSLTLCASLSVVDSLWNGKSKFLAEIDRLRVALSLANADRPVLFLIDEILSGTNSRDRRIAVEAVVRTLIDRGAIGALSTHDLALTSIADGLPGTNMHMGSRDGGEALDFDYRLKSGVTTESNALAIARMAGVPV